MSLGRPFFLARNGTPRSESAHGVRFLFTGREYVAPVGLYDYRHRAYSPTLGRFLQPDPIGFASGDFNLYRCCANNVASAVDPYGLCPEASNYKRIVRSWVEAAEEDARRRWWLPRWIALFFAAYEAHGSSWSALDVSIHRPYKRWLASYHWMGSGAFGNYLAGYFAGYAQSPLVLAAMHEGGFWHALLNRPQMEHWTDRDSVPYIQMGFEQGWADREYVRGTQGGQ